jgi:hypothetical protein
MLSYNIPVTAGTIIAKSRSLVTGHLYLSGTAPGTLITHMRINT